ncbi:site-specific integrase [Roseateles sp. DXS20W]|uniref:Site-specific integrase n=1 Tax=Pelomonas lactea TaxID=3299030 RepID=A0ABW7GQC3_9BURK
MFKDVVLEAGAHHWRLAASALYPDAEPIINWRKLLPVDKGTKHQRAYLTKSSKEFLEALIDMPSAQRRGTLSHATVENWWRWLRRLVVWMVERDLWRFSQLGPEAMLEFLRERSVAADGSGERLRNGNVFVVLMRWLWDLRFDYTASLRVNPSDLMYEIDRLFPPKQRHGWKAVDEAVALPLLRDAIWWLKVHGTTLQATLRKRALLERGFVGITADARSKARTQAYRAFAAEPEFADMARDLGMEGARPYYALRRAVNCTEGACLIILLFMVGFRCRELVSMDSDAMVREDSEAGEPLYRLRGVAAKKGGEARTWVASGPVVDAVEYLVSMHVDARTFAGQKALLIGRRGGNPVVAGSAAKRISTHSIGPRMLCFANSAFRDDRPRLKHLHPHSARKTFARFVVLRDKRALESLAYHYGHTHRLITDGCYVGSDIELAQMVNEESRRDLAAGLTDILSSSVIAGKAAGNLQKFAGSGTSKLRGRKALESLVDRLIGQGVQLAPCDWGYCVYSQALSACRGDALGPNEANRSAEVCSSCANFVVTDKHRGWWTERAERDAQFLDTKGLPAQTVAWVQRRLDGTHQVLRSLNAGRLHATSQNQSE